MRYPKDHRDHTRQKIIDAALKLFNLLGVEGAGIADIMKEAGLTKGAFSKHFASKEELVREAIDYGFTKNPIMPPQFLDKPLETLIEGYLSPGHRDSIPECCAASTLAAEIARHPLSTRQVFLRHLETQFASLDSKISPHMSDETRRKKSIAIFALLMGSMVIARLAKDANLSDEMLQAGIDAAKDIGGV